MPLIRDLLDLERDDSHPSWRLSTQPQRRRWCHAPKPWLIDVRCRMQIDLQLSFGASGGVGSRGAATRPRQTERDYNVPDRLRNSEATNWSIIRQWRWHKGEWGVLKLCVCVCVCSGRLTALWQAVIKRPWNAKWSQKGTRKSQKRERKWHTDTTKKQILIFSLQSIQVLWVQAWYYLVIKNFPECLPLWICYNQSIKEAGKQASCWVFPPKTE